MSGNDIVDLTAAAGESNWKRKGFLTKLFTWREQYYINNAVAPEAMLWRLWTMKESAYKIQNRNYGGRFFAPQKFKCSIINESDGIVHFNNNRFQTITQSTTNYIYSIAGQDKTDWHPTINSCILIEVPDKNNQQLFIYNRIIYSYHQLSNKTGLSVIKENGIPFLYCNTDKSRTPVSITHHGRYAAFTIK